MKKGRLYTKGFTLIATLLMLLMLSGIAIGLMMMVNTEGKVGGTDLQNDIAFHAAEGGIEKMGTDLGAALTNAQSPTIYDICTVNSLAPNIPGITFSLYQVQPAGTVTCNSSTAAQQAAALTCPTKNNCWGQISGGPDQGLYAQVFPVNMTDTATALGGQQVSMIRQAQIALIPVFQYGVFCEGDCAFFNNPTLDFAGHLHANGDLYLGVASGNTITFHAKLEAFGNVVTNNLPNGLTASSTGDTGNVFIPTADGNCPTPGSSSGTCVQFPSADGSVNGIGGSPPATLYNTSFNIGSYASSYNSAFNTFSSSVNHELINADYGNKNSGQVGTGAKLLKLPFVSGTVHNYELIRRPTGADSSTLSQDREYNMAQIHVLLSDDPNDLPYDSSKYSNGAQDPNNVRLANLSAAQTNAQYSGTYSTATANLQFGVPISSPNYNATTFGTAPSGYTFNLYFAAASNVVPWGSQCTGSSSCAMDWPYAPAIFTAATSTAPTKGLQPVNSAPTAVGAVNSPAYQIPPSGAAALVTGLCPPSSPALAGTVTAPTGCPSTPAYPYYAMSNPIAGTSNYASGSSSSWSLVDGYLRVEYVDANGAWHPVTNEWLGLGFARGVTPPTSPGTNPITPSAILLFQEPADRDGNGTVSTAATAPSCSSTNSSGKCTAWSGQPPEVAYDLTAHANSINGTGGEWAFGLTPSAPVLTGTSATPQSITQYNWYPINFYDAREGEPRDANTAGDSCTTIGAMNAVEIDVGNLAAWIANATSGKAVDYVKQNGYILYFSDRRGMLLNPHPPMNPTGASAKTGDSGLEDVINPSSASDTPNGTLDSPEDVNQNGYLDTFGTANLGLGFWNNSASNLNAAITATSPANPYSTRISSCGTTARKNWVSGARHVLKLVDGSLGNLPISPVPVSVTVSGKTTNYYGGFTVASENPVYIQGDYNSNSTDTFFSKATGATPGPDTTSPIHVPAAIVADTVTFLSDAWNDYNSTLLQPSQPTPNRSSAGATYYRVAVAAGKTLPFPWPSAWESGTNYPTGTDGGVGNFLRFLEDWSGNNLYYGGSMVEMFYNTYNTGMFKCCTYSVYRPPFRNYYFDTDFQTPQGLPPGTPMFRDVETLGYRQLFAPRSD